MKLSELIEDMLEARDYLDKYENTAERTTDYERAKEAVDLFVDEIKRDIERINEVDPFS